MDASLMVTRSTAEEELVAARWRAVVARDASASGLFVYGVRSTGVYCRPGCPARRPLRSNVAFFSTCSEADDAGYRPCRRCRPATAGSDQVGQGSPAVAAVVAACRLLEEVQGAPDVAGLAGRLGWSERHLRRMFASVVGVPIGAYLRAQQAGRAREALRSGAPVTQAAFQAGFGSSRAFYEHAAPRLGMSPSRYRDGGTGVRVTYTTFVAPIGRALVAATAKGVCLVDLGVAGEDEAALVARLRQELPAAVLERDEEGLAELASVVGSAIRGEADATALPVDLVGTAFQARVWEALRAIPAGQTRSYSEVAAAIGRPSAVRAVAGACAANPVPILVPCHRVVRQDGTLGGFRYGLAAKQALLAAEDATLPE